AAGPEDAEVGGDDLPIVLRHGHGHDLVRTGEKGRKRGGDALRARVELGERQRLAGMGNLQGGELRKSLGGAAEYLSEPLNPLLVWRVDEAGIAEDIGQAVRAVIRPRYLLRRPQVAPPCCERQHKESCEGCCGQCCCQVVPRWSGRRSRLLSNLRAPRPRRSRRPRPWSDSIESDHGSSFFHFSGSCPNS